MKDFMKAVSLTNRGGRNNNEDCIGYAQSDGLWCFVLCDGLGGHCCGEVASKLVCNMVRDEFLKTPDLSERSLYRYIEKAASVLSEERESNEDKVDMSTTVIALVTDGERAVWGHSGDSRLYYISDNEIFKITDDHSVAFMEFESGKIAYDDIRKSPNQNKLVRSISDFNDFNPDISEVINIKKGDAFLLCSDGFWEYVHEDDIERTVAETSSPKVWLEKMLEVLHRNEHEKNDNYSVIAVMV